MVRITITEESQIIEVEGSQTSAIIETCTAFYPIIDSLMNNLGRNEDFVRGAFEIAMERVKDD